MNIVWLGDLGFPVGMAPVRRILLILSGLVQCGAEVMVINTYGIHNEGSKPDIEKVGIYKDIQYIHASGRPYRPKNFLVRNLFKVWGLINEIYILNRLKKKGKLDAAILHADRFKTIVFYRMLSKLFVFPLIMNYVELNSSISRRGIIYKIDSYLYEKYGFFLIDGIMPISDYLIDIVKSRNPGLPVLKVPIICNLERFNGVERKIKEKYFLLCCSAIYIEVIIFALKAFEILENSERIGFYLVSNGTPAQMSRLKEEIAKNRKCDLIKLFSGITDDHLTLLYANACALLVPLRPTVQDSARFPHKIGEYAASGNPIVTTNYGEVPKYFEDGKSALIADNYDVEGFAEKMKFIILDPDKAKEIGQKGRQVGIDNFNYKQHGHRIKEFIDSIIARRHI